MVTFKDILEERLPKLNDAEKDDLQTHLINLSYAVSSAMIELQHSRKDDVNLYEVMSQLEEAEDTMNTIRRLMIRSVNRQKKTNLVGYHKGMEG